MALSPEEQQTIRRISGLVEGQSRMGIVGRGTGAGGSRRLQGLGLLAGTASDRSGCFIPAVPSPSGGRASTAGPRNGRAIAARIWRDRIRLNGQPDFRPTVSGRPATGRGDPPVAMGIRKLRRSADCTSGGIAPCEAVCRHSSNGKKDWRFWRTYSWKATKD